MGGRRAHPDVYQWRPRIVMIPRFGMMVTRDGARSGLILPGRYLVRRSRTMGQMMYRRT